MVKIIRVIGKLPGHPPFEVFIPNDLRALQTFVRGCIETLTITSDMLVVANREGARLGLPVNCSIAGHMLCGPVLLVGYKDDVFCDVPLPAEESPWSMWIKEVQHDQP